MIRLSKKTSDSLFILIPVWFNRLKAIIFLPVIIAYIGIDSYGAFVLILANIEMLTPFAHMGMGQALVRYTSAYDADNKNELRKGFWTPILAATIFSCLICIAYTIAIPIINETLMDGNDIRTLYASIPLIFANAIALIIFPYFNSRKRFKEASIYRVLRDLLPYLGLVTGVILTNELFAGIILLVIIQLFFLGFILIKITSEIGFLTFDRNILKKYLIYSWPLSITIFSQRSIETIPKYLISLFYGQAALGIYNILFTIIRLIIGFNIPFIKYTESHLPKLWDEAGRVRANEIINTCTRYYFIIVCCFATLIVMGIDDLLRIFFPSVLDNITIPIKPVMISLSVFALFYGINDFSRIFAKLKEKTILVLIVSVAGLTTVLTLAPILTKEFGLTGAAIAQFLSVFSMQILYTVTLKSNRSLTDYTYTIKTVIPILFSATAYWIIPKHDLLLVGLAAIISICIFAVMTHFLRIITMQEIISLGMQRNNKTNQ